MKKLFFFSAFLLAIGFTQSCKTDPCENTVCFNGGYCVNGDCVCPQGYTGADCSQQVTPDRITITTVSVTKFPATKADGAGWDLLDGPDVYLVIYDEKDNLLWKSDVYYEDVTSGVLVFKPNIAITDVLGKVLFRLYDLDTFNSDEFMGGVSGLIYNYSNGFPSKMNLDAGGNVAFEMSFFYSWR